MSLHSSRMFSSNGRLWNKTLSCYGWKSLCYIDGSRGYFTNGKNVRANDPFAILGLSWGASKKEIREAFRKKARELHPDVNKTDAPNVALKKFQTLQQAHQTLTSSSKDGKEESEENWSFHVWKQSDDIAQNRTDVAGVKRQRPIPSASATMASASHHQINRIGHPNGTGIHYRRHRGEYLSSGTKINSDNQKKYSKWVSKRPKPEYKPFDPSQSIPPITNTKLNNYYTNDDKTNKPSA